MAFPISKKRTRGCDNREKGFDNENPLQEKKRHTLDEIVKSLCPEGASEKPIKFCDVACGAAWMYLQSHRALTSRKLFESLSRYKHIISPASIESYFSPYDYPAVKTISIENVVALVIRHNRHKFPNTAEWDLEISHSKMNKQGTRRIPIHATSLLFYKDTNALKGYIEDRLRIEIPRTWPQTRVKYTLELEIEQLE